MAQEPLGRFERLRCGSGVGMEVGSMVMSLARHKCTVVTISTTRRVKVSNVLRKACRRGVP